MLQDLTFHGSWKKVEAYTTVPLAYVYVHEGTVVFLYDCKGAPCIWMASSLQIWPKRGNDDVHFRF